MGVDKATLNFDGRPLIAHALDILRGVGLSVRISGNRTDLDRFAETVEDSGSSQGPLGGICGALEVALVPFAVFIPVDLPLLPSSLIEFMLETAFRRGDAVVIPSVSGFAQTFPVVLSRATLPILKAELAAGRRGCFSAFQAAASALKMPVQVVATEMLVQAGQLSHPRGLLPEQWFFNVNVPADLTRAQALLHGQPRAS
jgi:Molybdopterin-guanine dinucleotide biosynthesis protein A